MPDVNQPVLYTTLFGQAVPVPQHAGADGAPKQTGVNNPLPVQLSGSNGELPVKAVPIKDMAIADITVTGTAIEIKAGASALANRKQIMLYAPSAGTIYWGKSGVTSATGLPLAAGSAPLILDVDASSPKLYAVSDGTNRTVKVGEFA